MLYDFEYDLQKFGNYLLDVRKRHKITQDMIRDAYGIHSDTIRNLEYGNKLPKLDTLIKIGEFYKIDILSILAKCKHDNSTILENISTKINHAAYSDDLEEVHKLSEELKVYASTIRSKENVLEKNKILQLDTLANILKSQNKRDQLSVSLNIDLCLSGLKLTNKNFEIHKVKTYYLSMMDCKFILVYSFMLTRQKKHDTAIDLTEYIIDYIKDIHELGNEAQKLILNAYHNLSYQLYLSGDDHKTITVCNYAIEYANQNYTNIYVANIYYRLGIAQLMLKDEKHMASLKKSLMIFELLNMPHLKEHYLEALKDKHQFSKEKLQQLK